MGGFRYDSGHAPVDHVLAGVEAVFLDEGHCYASTVRGDQILFLLQRLQRLREWGQRKGFTHSGELQICTAGATIPNAYEVARRLLGNESQAIHVAEARRIEFLDSTGQWRDVATLSGTTSLHEFLPSTDALDLAGVLISQRTSQGLRKVLVFVQSRAECEALTAKLRARLVQVADIWVGAHHSSLTRDHLPEARRRLLVARGSDCLADFRKKQHPSHQSRYRIPGI